LANSMTGFGAGEGPAGGGRLRVELRTVNHRFFNLSAKLPSTLAPLESRLRERLKRDFDRGHISLSLRWVVPPESGEGSVGLNVDRARAVVARLRELQAMVGVGGEVDLDMVARQPDVLLVGSAAEPSVEWDEIEPVVLEAIAECKAMRHREGEVITAELAHRLDRIEAAGREVEALAPRRIERERDRLSKAVAELLGGAGADEQRVAQEIAILADKLDITEELVRLGAHLAACREALDSEGPAGKRLGFLAQELGREINTIGSKANDADMIGHVVAMKGELETLREQLENLE